MAPGVPSAGCSASRPSASRAARRRWRSSSNTYATDVRSRRCVCASRSVLAYWRVRPHHCLPQRSVSGPCTCAVVGRGRRERRRAEAGLLHYGEAVGEGLQDGARGVRLAPRRQGATAGEAKREAPGAAGVVSVMSRARERETRRLSLSFLRYEGTEMRDGMGVVNNGMGGARTGRRVLAATARVSLTIHKKNILIYYIHNIFKKYIYISKIYYIFPHKHETHRSERWCDFNTSAQRRA